MGEELDVIVDVNWVGRGWGFWRKGRMVMMKGRFAYYS